MRYVRRRLLVIDLSCMVFFFPPKAAVKYRQCVCAQKKSNYSSFPTCLSVWHHFCFLRLKHLAQPPVMLALCCSIFQALFRTLCVFVKQLSVDYVNCEGKKITHVEDCKELRVLNNARLFVITWLCKVHCKSSELCYKFHYSPTLRC